MTFRLLTGDCRVLLASEPEASVDALVTDPPYELGFMGKAWDRSRAEIRELLSAWGCSGMGWTDHFREGDVELGFVWDPSIVARQGVSARRCSKHYLTTCEPCRWKDGYADLGAQVLFKVRMRLKVGTDPQAQRTAHRLLLLKIKADLNAAQAGLAKAEEVFLPWIVDAGGTTISEHVLPRLRETYALALKAGPKDEPHG